MNRLKELGLKEEMYLEFKKSNVEEYLGRVIAEYKGIYRVASEEDDILAKVVGKFISSTKDISDFPAVGDWVVMDRATNKNGDAIISRVLPRKSYVSRKVAGLKTDEQIIASNIDTLFICMAVNKDFNPRRLERYITIGWNSGARPVVILTKTDLVEDIMAIRAEIDDITIGLDVLYVSSITGDGMEGVSNYLKPGQTIGFIGSSGVGKSTLINYILGEERMQTGGIREEDSKGRHTTTHRELIVIKDKGIVIDTPGMREIQLLENTDGIDISFLDIVDLSKECKFNDCKHENEPGCAVRTAIKDGRISIDRLNSYNKLMKEAKFIDRKNNTKAQQEYKKQSLKLSKTIKDVKNRPY